jgi:hypothetical protein
MTRQEAFQLLVKLCAHSVPIPNGAMVKVCDAHGGGAEMSGTSPGRILVVPQGAFGALVNWLAEEVAQVAWVKESMAASAPAACGDTEDCRGACEGCPDSPPPSPEGRWRRVWAPLAGR